MKVIDRVLRRQASEVLGHLSSHLVALVWAAGDRVASQSHGHSADRFRVRGHLATGFLIHSEPFVFWITAGHILADLARAESAGRRMINPRLMVGWHNGPGQLFPFDYENATRFAFDDERLGADFGAVLIRPFYQAGLASVGVRPLPEMMWAKPTERFERYVMLGFPREQRNVAFQKEPTGGRLDISAGTPLMRLRLTDRPPKALIAKFPRFYARITTLKSRGPDGRITLTDIDGMSGGPVFGLRLSSKGLQYKLVAVQGSWSKPHRVIAACPIRPFVQVIRREIAAHINAQQTQ